MSVKDKYSVRPIPNEQCREWLLYKHYAHKIPSISYSMGLYRDKILSGICTFGSPPSPPLCIGICGKEYSNIVIELNRLVVDNIDNNALSYFVSKSIKLLPMPLIIVSYADTSMGYHGYIYQATNFIYTGLSDKRTEWQLKDGGLHSKTVCEIYSLEERKNNNKFVVVDRVRKHRYVYFHCSKNCR